MKNNKEHINIEDLGAESKKNSFQIPVNYFDSLKEQIEGKINENSDEVLSQVKRKNSFEVPAGYHSGLKSKLEDELVEVNSKKSKLRVMYFAIGAVAAVFIGLIIMNLPNQSASLLSENSKSVSVTVDEFQSSVIEEVEDFDPLLAMLSEDDMVSEYDELFIKDENKETTVEDIQEMFIDEWEDSEYDY